MDLQLPSLPSRIDGNPGESAGGGQEPLAEGGEGAELATWRHAAAAAAAEAMAAAAAALAAANQADINGAAHNFTEPPVGALTAGGLPAEPMPAVIATSQLQDGAPAAAACTPGSPRRAVHARSSSGAWPQPHLPQASDVQGVQASGAGGQAGCPRSLQPHINPGLLVFLACQKAARPLLFLSWPCSLRSA